MVETRLVCTVICAPRNSRFFISSSRAISFLHLYDQGIDLPGADIQVAGRDHPDVLAVLGYDTFYVH